MVIVLIVILGFLIIQPFIFPILSGAMLAYIFYPLFRLINKGVRKKGISALIVVIITVLIISFPLFFVLNTLSREAWSTYLFTKQRFFSGEDFFENCTEGLICKTYSFLAESFENIQVKSYLMDALKRIANSVIAWTSNLIVSLPARFLEGFVSLFTMFFCLIDGDQFVRLFWKRTLFRRRHQKSVMQRLSNVTYAVVYGSIIVALVQGIIAGIGYLIFGLKSPILWGVVTAFAALIPFVGTTLIWAPAAIILAGSGLINSEMGVFWRGVGLFIYGTLLISSADNIMKPKIIGERGKVHPVVVLIGVLGGLKVFGVIGILLGPVVLALCVTMASLYLKERV